MAKRKKAGKRVLLHDEKYVGTEPVWDDKPTPEQVKSRINTGLRYYGYFYSVDQLKHEVVAWLETHQKAHKISPETIKAYKASANRATSMTTCALVRMHDRGAPLNADQIKHIIAKVQAAIDTGERDEVTPAEASEPVDPNAPTVQTRMLAQARTLQGEIDGDMDLVFRGKKPALDVMSYLNTHEVSKPVAAKMRAMVEEAHIEIVAAKDKRADEQLVEAYAYLKGKLLKEVMTWFETTFAAFDNYAKLKNLSRKPRQKKVVSSDKLVAKMAYLKEFKEPAIGLSLVSIRPTDVIGAESLWIYDTKKRKVGVYYALPNETLSVKGSTIRNFDAQRSVMKRLRKPAEKLKELTNAGKVQLRKYLEGIKAVEQTMKGRITKDTILLRVV